MFTGIIEETGSIRSVRKGARSVVLTIGAELILSDLKLGDSIAVNGVCLTVTSFSSSEFTADVMHETIQRTSLFNLHSGSRVNLERAMPASGRFGGHMVSGHIDGTGVISWIGRDDNAIWYRIRTEPRIMKYIIEKGSVAVDGISLTVAKATEADFSVSVIPHTASHTILAEKKVGDRVNLENDCVGKYIEKLLGKSDTGNNNLSAGFLTEAGF